MIPVIVALRSFPHSIAQRVAALGNFRNPPPGPPLTDDSALAAVRDADALFLSALDQVPDVLVEGAPRLRIISSIGAGLNHIDLEACARRNIIVSNTPNAPTEPTADLSFGLLLAAARAITEADALVRAGAWTTSLSAPIGVDVHRRTIGIVGMGRIGRAIARRAQGFEMEILYSEPSPLETDLLAGLRAQWASLDDLLARSDFIVLQAPLTPETFHLIGPRQLALMKPSAVLVNTGRGGLVDEGALVDALEAGRLRSAALDVFEIEPCANQRVLACKKILLSPHIGTATAAARKAMVDEAIANLEALLHSRFGVDS